MATSLLIRATQGSTYKPGEVVTIRPGGQVWGSMEQPPEYIHMTISDADMEEVKNFHDRWEIKFRHVFVNENVNGWRYTIEVDPIYISVSDVGKGEIKAEVVNLIENGEYWKGSSVFKIKPEYVTADIPKNGPYQTASGLSDFDYLSLLKSNFADVFNTVLDVRRYYFGQADIDLALSQGGIITLTKLQALNKIIDKLEE